MVISRDGRQKAVFIFLLINSSAVPTIFVFSTDKLPVECYRLDSFDLQHLSKDKQNVIPPEKYRTIR